MIAVAGIAAFVLIILALSRSSAHAEEKAPAAAAQAVADANLTSDPAKLDAYASDAERAGYPQTADAIRKRAANIRAGGKALPPIPGDLRSPIPEASAASWTRFVKLMGDGNKSDTISPRGHLGIFQMSLPRLADLGLVTNLHKDRATGKYSADWVAPLTQEKFLGDPKLQYDTFVRSTVADRKAILARHEDKIGKVIARKVATLSGLLTVARQAGLSGLAVWLASGANKVKFPKTSSAYLRGNGVF